MPSSRKPFRPGGDARSVAGRLLPRVYPVAGRADVHEFLLGAVRASGGTVLYASSPKRVPVYLGLEDVSKQRLGLMIYPFRMTRLRTRNRPTNEIRGQLRYGAEESWTDDHFVARDVAGVDTTLLLGVYPDEDFLVGLDPVLYDPLPLGISVYAKDENAATVRQLSWAVWERTNRPGLRRIAPRAAGGQETLVGFSPERLLDYAHFERRATELGLDPPLRYAAAVDAASKPPPGIGVDVMRHNLELNFDLSAHQILDIIQSRLRLTVAVNGGVAEYHLGVLLESDPTVSAVTTMDQDAQPDFDVLMSDGHRVLVECKNVSPEPYANGDFKVEVQKTRATSGDPAGRLYRPDQFDIVAACLYSPTRRWNFRFIRSSQLARHASHHDRLAALHRVDERWSRTLREALDRDPGRA